MHAHAFGLRSCLSTRRRATEQSYSDAELKHTAPVESQDHSCSDFQNGDLTVPSFRFSLEDLLLGYWFTIYESKQYLFSDLSS